MKLVVVIGFSGGNGKSVLATHMLKPLLGARLVGIGPKANDEAHDHAFSVRDVVPLAGELIVEDESYVIDVKASAAAKFIEACSVLDSLKDAVDCWVVPCMPSYKPNASVQTVSVLREIGVESKRIAFVPNNIVDFEECRSVLQSCREKLPIGISFSDDFVSSSEAIVRLSSEKRSIFDVVNEKQDFEARTIELRKSGNEKLLLKLGHEMVFRDLCAHAAKNMSKVFGQLSALN